MAKSETGEQCFEFPREILVVKPGLWLDSCENISISGGEMRWKCFPVLKLSFICTNPKVGRKVKSQNFRTVSWLNG